MKRNKKKGRQDKLDKALKVMREKKKYNIKTNAAILSGYKKEKVGEMMELQIQSVIYGNKKNIIKGNKP